MLISTLVSKITKVMEAEAGGPPEFKSRWCKIGVILSQKRNTYKRAGKGHGSKW
jgi:hypothetical protein